MPNLRNSVPKYRKHRASGQAIVTLSGVDHYLGPHGSKVSRLEYDRRITEWLANGRRPFQQADETIITVAELILAYWEFADSYYEKGSGKSGELPALKVALAILRQSYGDKLVTEIGPLAIRAMQSTMVAKKWVRRCVNLHIGRIKRCFKWGASHELVPIAVYHAIATVPGLRQGKSDVKESEPIKPVSAAVVEATIKHLKPKLVAMVRFMQLTGCRPGEMFIMRSMDIDRSGKVWKYVPTKHKNTNRGKHRVVMIGPQAQAVIAKYMLKEPERYVFEQRQKQCYQRYQFSSRIRYACIQHKIERWHPNQLRHAAATSIRAEYGVEAASTILGHSRVNTTEIYAEKNLTQAELIALKVG